MSTHARDIDRLAARRIVVSGRVQGVGFRPFVYRIAHRLNLTGWVRNETGRVVIHVEGLPGDLRHFESMLTSDAPPLARPHLEDAQDGHPQDARGFKILESAEAAEADVHLPPDLFCCDDCIEELCRPSGRRYRYPFTNCTQCGPRYTIIEALPYDRSHTSMRDFTLCADCGAEYEDPLDRRFHAQPLACPVCGPTLTFQQGSAARLHGEAALVASLDLLRNGGIVAVKGVGGYHLMCDPANDKTVRMLRSRKHRPDKPFAVMFPWKGGDGLDAVRTCAIPGDMEARACAAPERPIVLMRRRDDCKLSSALAPGLSELGVLLPYSPLHHMLLSEFDAPLVATSGNISGEPVITDNEDAHARLGQIADGFLHHNRPIVRPADDSVARVIGGAPRLIRIGRGMAPRELDPRVPFQEPVLAVGGHMKGAIALGWNRRCVISPHIGELDSPRSVKIFEQVICDLQNLYHIAPRHIVCDAHPGYASTRWAVNQNVPLTRVLHHVAHASAVAGEHPDVARWLVFAWDGVGLGADNELWGGEAFLGAPGAWTRVASLRPFHLLGGDRTGREPWRSAAALMWETGRNYAPNFRGGSLARQAWQKRVGTNRTSSVGRLFDAAAALILDVESASFEGQGPMMLESVAMQTREAISLLLSRDDEDVLRMDWEPLLPMLLDQSLSPARRAGVFHESLARALAAQAATLAQTEVFEAVGLTGGVFQNRLLAERVMELLAKDGITGYLPSAVPANDGGLAFGQLIEARARLARGAV